MGRIMRKCVFGICGQQRPRSVCASTQSDKDFHCPLTESSGTTECIMESNCPDDTLRMRRTTWICSFCADLKAFVAWRGPNNDILKKQYALALPFRQHKSYTGVVVVGGTGACILGNTLSALPCLCMVRSRQLSHVTGSLLVWNSLLAVSDFHPMCFLQSCFLSNGK